MNIFNKITLESMKKSRTRTLVTIIGVILSAAMITGVATFGISLLDYMTKGAVLKYGNWQAMYLDVDSSFVKKQIDNKYVSDIATFENIGYAKLKGGKNPDKPYLSIVGFNDKTFRTMPINVFSGRLPKNSNEVVVSGRVTTNGGVKISLGDVLSLDVGNRMSKDKKLNQHDSYISGKTKGTTKEILVTNSKKKYKVVGICQRPCFEELTAPGYTVITKSDNENTDSQGVFVTLKDPYKIKSYLGSSSQGNSYVLNDNVLRFMGLSEDKLFNTLLYSLGVIVIAIIMVGSVFLIYNAFNISLNERIHQFGILSSVGATEKQLRNSVLFEGFCIGLIGIPIGVVVGLGSISGVISLVSKNFSSILYSKIPLTLTISPLAIAVACVVSMVTILISAYIPAKKAAKTPVMECIRQTNEIKVESKAVKTSRFAYKLYGLEGTLALKNFNRNKKRYRSIVLSLVLSIVLFISTSSFVMYLQQSSGYLTEFTTYDIGIATKDMKDDKMIKLFDELKNADSVYKSSYQALMKYTCSVKKDVFTDNYLNNTKINSKGDKVEIPFDIQFLDDNAYLDMIKSLKLDVNEYSKKSIAVAKIKDDSKKNSEANEFKNMFKSSSMNLDINYKGKINDSKNVNVQFVNAVPPDTLPNMDNTAKPSSQNYMFTVMMPYSMKSEFKAPVVVKGMTFMSKDCKLSADEMNTIIAREKIDDDYNLFNLKEAFETNNNMIFIANVFAYTFIVMISLIAVANVFNTISTNIKLRRRELAMLRSVGMSEGDFQKMMNFECVFFGLKSILFGIPIAIVFSYLIYMGMADGGIDSIKFSLPWLSMIISVFGVLFIVFVTMIYSISKIKKENIIDALRDDMN